MGFMDNIKKAQEAVSAAIPSAGDPGYAQKANKLWNQGTPAVATIKSISETGKRDLSGKQYALEVSVELGGETYDATVIQYMGDSLVPTYQPGVRVDAKVDPDDRSSVMVYGVAA